MSTIVSLYALWLDWGEMGFFRVELGKNLLMIESNIAWATPDSFTVSSAVNFPSEQDGNHNCMQHQVYVDPSDDLESIQMRLQETLGSVAT